MLKMRHLSPKDYQESSWSGGKTRQVYLFPQTSHYGDRDFDYRISTATVELERSNFTPLENYERILMTLDGNIDLIHSDSQEVISLTPYTPYAFSGASPIESRGTCTDFNLIHSPRYEGHMQAISSEQASLTSSCSVQLLYFLVDCRLELDGQILEIKKEESLLVDIGAQQSELVIHFIQTKSPSAFKAIWIGLDKRNC
ncbi:HutD/Ves family protein [Streptococcus oricebi]|uniref:HutD family protein n=1 Tax=Streptococcus oricebi TaxID=1547447 RepID=A0ABS5B680_9STRE|nr:HutD family protein [Streptococcus oricebi]MBP2623973.1 hypothetical protein [Streptococcus oricebi]